MLCCVCDNTVAALLQQLLQYQQHPPPGQTVMTVSVRCFAHHMHAAVLVLTSTGIHPQGDLPVIRANRNKVAIVRSIHIIQSTYFIVVMS